MLYPTNKKPENGGKAEKKTFGGQGGFFWGGCVFTVSGEYEPCGGRNRGKAGNRSRGAFQGPNKGKTKWKGGGIGA